MSLDAHIFVFLMTSELVSFSRRSYIDPMLVSPSYLQVIYRETDNVPILIQQLNILLPYCPYSWEQSSFYWGHYLVEFCTGDGSLQTEDFFQVSSTAFQ